jgi:hypothetical protein
MSNGTAAAQLSGVSGSVVNVSTVNGSAVRGTLLPLPLKQHELPLGTIVVQQGLRKQQMALPVFWDSVPITVSLFFGNDRIMAYTIDPTLLVNFKMNTTVRIPSVSHVAQTPPLPPPLQPHGASMTRHGNGHPPPNVQRWNPRAPSFVPPQQPQQPQQHANQPQYAHQSQNAQHQATRDDDIAAGDFIGSNQSALLVDSAPLNHSNSPRKSSSPIGQPPSVGLAPSASEPALTTSQHHDHDDCKCASPSCVEPYIPQLQLQNSNQINTTPLRVCAYNQRCERGAKCERVHGFFDEEQEAYFRTLMQTKPHEKKILQMLCVHHMIGDCHDGFKCTYRHLIPHPALNEIQTRTVRKLQDFFAAMKYQKHQHQKNRFQMQMDGGASISAAAAASVIATTPPPPTPPPQPQSGYDSNVTLFAMQLPPKANSASPAHVFE